MLTVLHAGGKFGDGGGYKVSGGLHGVGVSVVNALSEELHVEIRRDGYVWTPGLRARRAPGRAGAGRADGARPARRSPSCPTPRSSRRSTSSSRRSSSACARPRSSPAACGSRSTDERGEGAKAEFHYEGGIEDFVRYLNENKDPIQKKVIFFEGDGDEGAVEVAMQWNSSYQESVFSFANNINTHEGGSHLSGFRSALTAHAQPLRAREGPAQGEGRRPRRARTSARA